MIGAAPSWKLICCTKCGRKRYYSQCEIDRFKSPYLCKSCSVTEIRKWEKANDQQASRRA